MPRRTLSREDYTIGIVCAMDFEQDAVQATFDKRHGQAQSMAGDENNYVFGKIGEHNVAVACLSKAAMMHTRSAATVITDMVRSFPMIKVGLLVGIGGGTWSERVHIELKDVVVSLPGNIHGALNARSFLHDIEGIAQQLRIRSDATQNMDVEDLVRRHLSTERAGRWLLIVDNADDTEMFKQSLLRYLPTSPLGVTIFTTRHSSVARSLAVSNLLEVKDLSLYEATKLLKTTMAGLDSFKDPKAVAELLAELRYIPLAIIQAAAYINHNEIPVPEYLRLFRSGASAASSALDNRKQKIQRRPRRTPAPYSYPVAGNLAGQYTLDGIDAPQTSSAPGDSSLGLPSARKPTRLQRIKPCYVMVMLGFLAMGGSLAVGLFYSIAQDRMGDGFTTAGWMVAVSTLMLAAPMAKHYPNCRCWDSHEYAVL